MLQIRIELDNIEQEFYLPAVPRIGEQIYIGTAMLKVLNVTYTKNSHKVFLNVERWKVD